MALESNLYNSNLLNEKPKGGLLLAILLGLLTFFITSVIALIVIILFLPFGINVAAILLYGAWGGYVVAQFTLFILFALFGNFGTAIISWFINRSKKLATITFFSALIFQIIVITIGIPLTLKKSQKTMNAGIEIEKSFKKYATIGDVKFEVQEPFSKFVNGKEVFLFQKLILIIPISVSRAGTYQISARYNNETPMKNVTQLLNAGANTIRIEFLANESREYGYFLPTSTKSIANIELSYSVSQKEILDNMKSDKTIDPKILQQFIKDQGLDKGINSNSNVNKFIGKKKVQF